jgi:hypothetical protein
MRSCTAASSALRPSPAGSDPSCNPSPSDQQDESIAEPTPDAVLDDLHSLEGTCPCGTLKLYKVTHALPENAEIFTRLIR